MVTGAGVTLLPPLAAYRVGVPPVVLAGGAAGAGGALHLPSVAAGAVVAIPLPLVADLVCEPLVIKALGVARVGGAHHGASVVAGAGVAVLPPLRPYLPGVPLAVSAGAGLGGADHPAAGRAPAGVAATPPLVPRLVGEAPVIGAGVGARLAPVSMEVQAGVVMGARGLAVLIQACCGLAPGPAIGRPVGGARGESCTLVLEGESADVSSDSSADRGSWGSYDLTCAKSHCKENS